MILATGATGNAGGAVMRTVPERGETPKPHLAGISVAFVLNGYGGLRKSLSAMSDAGFERVVLLSSSAEPGRYRPGRRRGTLDPARNRPSQEDAMHRAMTGTREERRRRDEYESEAGDG